MISYNSMGQMPGTNNMNFGSMPARQTGPVQKQSFPQRGNSQAELNRWLQTMQNQYIRQPSPYVRNQFPVLQQQFTAKQIDPTDLLTIQRSYGDQIQDIFELGSGQKWMFDEGRHNKSAFFLQILLKIEAKIEPEEFRKQVDLVCERNAALRFAYIYRGLKRPYCVELKNRKAEVVFEDLSYLPEEKTEQKLKDLCAVDKKRGFDLEKDSLLRIGVYRLPDKDNFAVLISQPHINSDGVSVGILIKDLLIDYVLKLPEPVEGIGDSPFKIYEQEREHCDKNAELAYWRKYLEGIPERQDLPGRTESDGEFRETVYFSPFKPETVTTIKELQKTYKCTSYNIIQAAWGIMMSKILGVNDIVFGAISAGRDMAAVQVMTVPGGFVKVLPVRISLEDHMKVSELAEKVQGEFVKSMANSHCAPAEIKKELNRSEPVFNHILNCHNFSSAEGGSPMSVKIPGFKILGGYVYDNLSADLSVYIRSEEGQLGAAFGYNASVFAKEVIMLYAEAFNKVLDQIAEKPDLTVGEITCIDLATFEYASRLKEIETLKKLIPLRRIPLFEGFDDETMVYLAEHSSVKAYEEDELMIAEGEEVETVPFVIKGKAEVRAKSRDGWYNPIRIEKEGSMLSDCALADDRRAWCRIIAYTNVEILCIPREVFADVAASHQVLAMRYVGNLRKLLRQYQMYLLNQ